MLYFMMVPQLNIAQLYLPQMLNGYGMCALFISVWIYTFDNVPQNTILPSVAPIMIFRSFVMMGLFTTLFGWLQYELQWQSIGNLAIYFDTLTANHYPETGSLRDIQSGAILSANKTLLGYASVVGLAILTFVLLFQFGRLKYRIARHPLYIAKKLKQAKLSQQIGEITGSLE
jgi:hypothetical protein